MAENNDPPQLTFPQLLKLGAFLGIAWGLIFTGCLANMPGKVGPAAQLSAIMMAVVVGIVFFLPQYLKKIQEMEEEE